MTARASMSLFLLLWLAVFVAITGLDWDDYWVAQAGRAALTPRQHLGYALFTSGFLGALATIGARWAVAGWIGGGLMLRQASARLRLRPRAAGAAGLALVAGLSLLHPQPAGSAPAAVEADRPTPPEEGGRRWQLTLSLLPDSGAGARRLLVVDRPWFYCYAPTGEVMRVPAGYVTDLASVPDAAQPFVPPFGTYAEASVLHDWLYTVQMPAGRKRADRIMLFAMRDFRHEAARTNPYQAWAIYRAVRLFGWSSYYFRGEQEWRERWAGGEGADGPPSRAALAWTGRSPSRCERFREELEAGLYPRQFERRRAALAG